MSTRRRAHRSSRRGGGGRRRSAVGSGAHHRCARRGRPGGRHAHRQLVTSISWIPSEAITGITKGVFEVGFTHYDEPPPIVIGPDVATMVEQLRAADRFRFANHLAAHVEFADDGSVVDADYEGGGTIGATTVKLGKQFTVAAVSLPDRQLPAEVGDGWVRFTQTSGGRTGFPAPRAVRRPPFVQYSAPIAWSTLELTVHADGRSVGRLVGASPFPRHWVYDDAGSLTAKSGLIDYKDWAGSAFGGHTPWGDEDSPALVTAVESALERQLSGVIMGGAARPTLRALNEGTHADGTGRPRHGAVPAARWRARRRGRRRRGGRGRSRSGRRGACLVGGRRAHVDAAGAHTMPGRRRAVRRHRPRPAAGACPGATAASSARPRREEPGGNGSVDRTPVIW